MTSYFATKSAILGTVSVPPSYFSRVFEGVAVPVAVKVVDHRITHIAGVVTRRQKNAVISLLGENFREMFAIVKGLRGAAERKRRDEQQEHLRSVHGPCLRFHRFCRK